MNTSTIIEIYYFSKLALNVVASNEYIDCPTGFQPISIEISIEMMKVNLHTFTLFIRNYVSMPFMSDI